MKIRTSTHKQAAKKSRNERTYTYIMDKSHGRRSTAQNSFACLWTRTICVAPSFLQLRFAPRWWKSQVRKYRTLPPPVGCFQGRGCHFKVFPHFSWYNQEMTPNAKSRTKCALKRNGIHWNTGLRWATRRIVSAEQNLSVRNLDKGKILESELGMEGRRVRQVITFFISRNESSCPSEAFPVFPQDSNLLMNFIFFFFLNMRQIHHERIPLWKVKTYLRFSNFLGFFFSCSTQVKLILVLNLAGVVQSHLLKLFGPTYLSVYWQLFTSPKFCVYRRHPPDVSAGQWTVLSIHSVPGSSRRWEDSREQKIPCPQEAALLMGVGGLLLPSLYFLVSLVLFCLRMSKCYFYKSTHTSQMILLDRVEYCYISYEPLTL